MRFARLQAFCNDGKTFQDATVSGVVGQNPSLSVARYLRFLSVRARTSKDTQLNIQARADGAMNLGTRGALTFRLGDTSFAVRVEEAGGVLDAERLAQLPGVCDPVAGVAAFRGEMVPVVDLAQYLGIESASTHRYALVLYRGPDRFALLIPEIPKLIPGRDLREAPPTDRDSELGDVFESVLENDQDQFHCLNYWRIFETIIPPAGGSAGRNASRERG